MLTIEPELVPMAVALGVAGGLIGYYTVRKFQHDPDMRFRRPKTFPTLMKQNDQTSSAASSQ